MQMQRKIKRVQPIIRMKQQKVDEEAQVLEAIRLKKREVVQSMKDSQRQYMEGINQLNQVRKSPTRPNLETLESAVDHVKRRWQKLFVDVQEIERQEKQQIAQLLTAERELKSVEKLKERYEETERQEAQKSEQRTLDEVALRRFLANVRGEHT